MVSLPAWLKCRCFRPSLPGDDDTPAPKKMSSSAADAQGFRTDQVSGAEAFTGVAAREPVQLPRAVSYPAASAAAQQPRTGAGLDELDPDMFVIKDLDSGKKYDLQQGLVVKDLTTGQMYGLDKTSSDACGESSTHLTDIASGRKITLDEFSGVLGNDSTFTRSNIRMPQSCSSDAPSLHQLPTAATIAPSQEPGLQALAHGFTGSRPSHGGHTDKPHTCVKSLSLLRHQVKALPLTSLCLTPKGQALDHSQGPSQWASASRTGSLVRRPRNFRQQRQKGSDAASAGSPPTTEGIKAERMGWDDFSRHEYLNPQGAQELRAQRQASG
ncbi:hypothetical protein WJX82_004437 [Trebouxia sp. C0006]